MSDNDDEIKNLITKSKNLAPRRCASTTGITGVTSCFPNLTLREARSCTGTMSDLKYIDSEKQMGQITPTNRYFCEHECEGDDKTGIPTVNTITNETYYVKETILQYNGQKYTASDIAQRWKKDCRKWLWKNSKKSKI